MTWQSDRPSSGGPARGKATAITLVALAVGAVSPAWGSSGDKHRQKTFTVEALTTEQSFEGTALGNQSVQRNEAQCVATYALPGGQITGQALIVLGDPAPYAVAITGGSGRYKGVEGEVRVDPASATQPRGVLTFHLQD